ncbi:hypothetical protein HK096_009127, partial [Nowakowskiella sp. JEL0078]
MSEYNNIFPNFLVPEEPLFFGQSGDLSEFFSMDVPMFESVPSTAIEIPEQNPYDFTQNFLTEPSFSQSPGILQDFFSPELTAILTPPISAATTLQASPNLSPPSLNLFENFASVPSQSSVKEMHTILEKYGYSVPPEFNMQNFMMETSLSPTSFTGLQFGDMTPQFSPAMDSMVIPESQENLPQINISGLKKVLETFVKRQQDLVIERRMNELQAGQPKKSKVGRKPKPRPTDP